MGVIHIREENPWAEFIQGLAPMATAWGDRYIQRDMANTLNKYQEYKNGGNNTEENSNSEYFFNVRDLKDTSDTPYFTPSSAQSNPMQRADSLFNYQLGQSPSTTSITPYSGNQVSLQPDNQGNPTRAELLRRGAPTIGAVRMAQLLDEADRSNQLKSFRYDINTSPMEFYRNAGNIY